MDIILINWIIRTNKHRTLNMMAAVNNSETSVTFYETNSVLQESEGSSPHSQ
jgi:hypothetical protein